MSYTINLTNGATLCTIPDGTLNSSAASTLTLIGKNYAGYGQYLDDNFVRSLENSSLGTAPGSPLVGQLWWDSTNKVMKVYPAAGASWKAVGAATSSTTAPAANVSGVGDLWFDTTNQQLKIYNGSQYGVVGPPYSSSQGISGAIPVTLFDAGGNSHTALATYVGNTVVAVTSSDPTYTPVPGIPGFANLNPGTTMASSITNAGGATSNTVYLWGTATNALNLGGVPASQYITASGSNTANVTLNKLNTLGDIGCGGNLTVAGTSGFTGAVTMSSTLGVTGNITTAANVNASGMTVTNNAYIGQNLQIAVSLGVGPSGTAPYSTVAGEIRASNNITGFYASDIKFKTNIQTIQGALSKVECIGGKTFDWTDEYVSTHGGDDGYYVTKSDFGVIAQDVQQVFPTAVRTREDGSLAVDYVKLAALAFAAINELNAKVDALAAKII